MTHMPLRLRAMKGGQTLVVNDAGRFFAGSADFLARLADEKPTIADETFLRKRGHVVADDDALGKAAFVRGVADRIVQAGSLDYLILVPTLRCNLSCSYCQVSRVAASASGHDWSDETLVPCWPSSMVSRRRGQDRVPGWRADAAAGSAPRSDRPVRSLRPGRVRRLHQPAAVDAEVVAILDRPDVFVSTSLDGTRIPMRASGPAPRLRPAPSSPTCGISSRGYGPAKVSALPTVDPSAPPEPDALIDAYAASGSTASTFGRSTTRDSHVSAMRTRASRIARGAPTTSGSSSG